MEKRQLTHLTGFRAVAAYLVLIAHAGDTAFSYSGIPVLHPYMQWLAYVGMSLFFVLSGFVITYNYAGKFGYNGWWRNTYNFVVARFARLFPLYALFLLLSMQYIPSPTFEHKPEHLITFLTLTQSWVNFEYITFPPAWSISTECFFYLCFALWMALPERKWTPSTITKAAVATVVFIVAVLYAIFSHKQGVANALQPIFSKKSNPDVMGWLMYCSPYIRIGEFIMGAFAAKLFMATQAQPISEATTKTAARYSAGALAIMAMLLAGFVSGLITSDSFLYFMSYNFLFAPLVAYIIYASSRYPIFTTRWGSTSWMVFGGEISYSVYLTQFWVALMVSGFVSTAASPLAYANSSLRVVLIIILTTIVSYGTYTMLEMPCRRLLRKWLSVATA